MDAIDKINSILARKGMTGAELERKIGASNSVYSQWNTKTTKPSNKSLVKVADALGVDVVDISPDKIEKPAPESGNELDIKEFVGSLTRDQLLDLIVEARIRLLDME